MAIAFVISWIMHWMQWSVIQIFNVISYAESGRKSTLCYSSHTTILQNWNLFPAAVCRTKIIVLPRVLSQVFMECNDVVCNLHVLESTCRPLVVLLLLLSLLGKMGSQWLYRIICLFLVTEFILWNFLLCRVLT